ncbi:hypothetical protein [Streptomyces sp. NPDC047028]|uniref:ParB/RepB/Spo0J family partition protein n=1 Tax=Streptomyces sp. NPDC047028 TaxID=3155793 RepID=UPI0033C69689
MPSPENGRKTLLKINELANTLRTDGMNTAMTVIPPEAYVELYPQHREEVEARVAAGVLFVVHHGHRRLAAALHAGLTEVPILVRRDVPSLRIAAIQENLQRMSLNPIEEAVELQGALDEENEAGQRLSQRELAKRVGCSQTYVSHRLALLRLVPDLQQAVIDHWLKEEQLLDTSGMETSGDTRLLLPVREAATVYSRLRTDLQEAFIRRELSPSQAPEVSRLPLDQQTIPRAEPASDCDAITDAESPGAPLPEPRSSEPAQTAVQPATPHSEHSPPELPETRPDSNSPAEPQIASPSTAAGTSLATVEEPRGVIVVRSVEQLALSIVDLLDASEIDTLKELLSS